MPIYEYQCKECDRRLEALQRLSEPPLTTCPECGGELKKLLSAPAFQFKGEGWYVTDYARKGKEGGKETGEKTGGEKAGEKGSGEGKGEKASASSDKAASGSDKGASGSDKGAGASDG